MLCAVNFRAMRQIGNYKPAALFLFFFRGGKINVKIFNIVVTIYQYISYICIEQKENKMKTIVINKSETLSMIFTPENPKGRITKTQDVYKMAMDAVKHGTAEKTCDTETTLMYKINA